MNAFAPPTYSFPNEEEDKKRFAELLLRFGERGVWQAAQAIGGNDVGKCMFIANNWVNDKDVSKNKKQLVEEHGEESFLPSKAQLAREIWDRANSAFTDEDFTKMMKLYAEVRGFIEKPAPAVINNNQNVIVPRVMMVQDNGSDEEWRQKLIENQRNLIDANPHDSNATTIRSDLGTDPE